MRLLVSEPPLAGGWRIGSVANEVHTYIPYKEWYGHSTVTTDDVIWEVFAM